jgi:acyl-CoA thioesterase
VTSGSPSVADVIATLHVDPIDDDDFVATQLDNAGHHIVGGHIAGQALMAASRTAPGRTPHSVHVYYLRAGDARRPVDFHVARSRDGGTLSTRQVTARQDGEVLPEALASFSTPVDGLDHQTPMADVPNRSRCQPYRTNSRHTPTSFTATGSGRSRSNCATSTRRPGWPLSCPSHRRESGCGGGQPNPCPTTGCCTVVC